jgi:hypothetical protein
MEHSKSLILSTARFINNKLVNRITININNIQSRNTLHHGKHLLRTRNKLIRPVTINRKTMETM